MKLNENIKTAVESAITGRDFAIVKAYILIKVE